MKATDTDQIYTIVADQGTGDATWMKFYGNTTKKQQFWELLAA